MSFRIQLRRDTAANWAANNPVLLLAEFGYEQDTGFAKIGDGVNPWNDLPYFMGGTGGVDFFTELGDTPGSYTGATGYFVSVKQSADGLEFNSPQAIAGVLASEMDITSLSGFATGDALLYLRVNAGGTGLEWAQAGGTGGTGSDFYYTNATPMPEAVGGFGVGTTFDNVPLKDMWDTLLYPFQQPAFGTVSVSPVAGSAYGVLEVGQSMDTNVNFNWTTVNSSNFQAGSVSILDVTDSTTIATGLNAGDSPESYTYGTAIRKTSKASHTWNWTALSTKNLSFSKTNVVNWYYPVFSGRSTSETLTNTGILGLSNRSAKASSGGSYTFSSASPGNYIYICIPDSYNITNMTVNGLPLATADSGPYTNSGPNGLRYATVSSVDINGVSTTYRTYRSKNKLAGGVTIIVSA